MSSHHYSFHSPSRTLTVTSWCGQMGVKINEQSIDFEKAPNSVIVFTADRERERERESGVTGPEPFV